MEVQLIMLPIFQAHPDLAVLVGVVLAHLMVKQELLELPILGAVAVAGMGLHRQQ